MRHALFRFPQWQPPSFSPVALFGLSESAAAIVFPMRSVRKCAGRICPSSSRDGKYRAPAGSGRFLSHTGCKCFLCRGSRPPARASSVRARRHPFPSKLCSAGFRLPHSRPAPVRVWLLGFPPARPSAFPPVRQQRRMPVAARPPVFPFSCRGRSKYTYQG